MTMATLSNLPNEVVEYILHYLSPRDVCTFRRINRACKYVVDGEPSFWQRNGNAYVDRLFRGLCGSAQLSALAAAPLRIVLHCKDPIYIAMDDTVTNALLADYDAIFLERGVTFGLSGTLQHPRSVLPSLQTLTALDFSDCQLKSLASLPITPKCKTINVGKNAFPSFAGLERTQVTRIDAVDIEDMALIDGAHLPSTLRSLTVFTTFHNEDDEETRVVRMDHLLQLRELQLFLRRIHSSSGILQLPPNLHVLNMTVEVEHSGWLTTLPASLCDLTLNRMTFPAKYPLPPQLMRCSLRETSADVLCDENLLLGLDAGGGYIVPWHLSEKSKTLESLEVVKTRMTSRVLQAGLSVPLYHAPPIFSSLRELCIETPDELDFADIAFPETLREVNLKSSHKGSLEDLALPARLVKLRLACIYSGSSLESIKRYAWLEELTVDNMSAADLASIEFPASLRYIKMTSVRREGNAEVSWPVFPDALAELNLDCNGITSLASIQLPPCLKKLSLMFNKLTSLADVTFPPTLEVLHLSGNRISNLNGAVLPATLRVLDLERNCLSTISGVAFPSAMQTLDLNHNRIETLEDVNFPSSLHTLQLGSNELSSVLGAHFPAGLSSLSLKKNHLGPIVDAMMFPSKLQHLNLSHNGLTKMDARSLPPSLLSLHLNRNPLERLDGLEHLRSLRRLDVSHRPLCGRAPHDYTRPFPPLPVLNP